MSQTYFIQSIWGHNSQLLHKLHITYYVAREVLGISKGKNLGFESGKTSPAEMNTWLHNGLQWKQGCITSVLLDCHSNKGQFEAPDWRMMMRTRLSSSPFPRVRNQPGASSGAEGHVVQCICVWVSACVHVGQTFIHTHASVYYRVFVLAEDVWTNCRDIPQHQLPLCLLASLHKAQIDCRPQH